MEETGTSALASSPVLGWEGGLGGGGGGDLTFGERDCREGGRVCVCVCVCVCV